MSQPSLAILSKLLQWIEQQQNPQQLCQQFPQQLVQYLQLPDQVIYLAEPGAVLTQVAAAGSKFCPVAGVNNPIRLMQGQGIVGLAAQQADSLLINDTRHTAHYIKDDAARLAELATPILYQGELLAVLDAEHPQAGFFQPDHLFFYQSLAAVLGPRLANLQAKQRLASSVLLSASEAARPAKRPAPLSIAPVWCSAKQFAQALVYCLKHFLHEQRWPAELLQQLALLACLPSDHHSRAFVLKQLIQQQLQQLAARPATALWGRLLQDRYTQQRLSQMQLADQFHMAFSTFRRHQSLAIQSLNSLLWQQELYCRQQYSRQAG
ncbi:GAF domain-containing protein [Arsukibacterium sp.]|uniref:GAF domain-containing protein n=1 Tax=Arsukibacterium sp. TaxID=1977258 RepID=UPI002FD8C0C5